MRTVSKLIITVDDIDEFIQSEKTLLNRQDFDYLTVKSGEEAMFLARNRNPDLLILNFYMPDLNGYAVCRELKSDPTTDHIPILIIAAHGDENEDPSRVTQTAGCDGCIPKPINSDDIVPAVEKCLEIPPRRHLRADASLTCGITDEDGRREGTILNITPEGIFVETSPAPWPGDIISGEVFPDDTDTPLSFQMAVRWSRETSETGPVGAGCELLGPSDKVVQWFMEQSVSSQGKNAESTL